MVISGAKVSIGRAPLGGAEAVIPGIGSAETIDGTAILRAPPAQSSPSYGWSEGGSLRQSVGVVIRADRPFPRPYLIWIGQIRKEAGRIAYPIEVLVDRLINQRPVRLEA